MISGDYTLQATAVSPVRGALPVIGGGAYAIGDERRRAVGRRDEHGASQGATDATGLSLSADEIADGLASLERDLAATAQERAYRAAGERLGRFGLTGIAGSEAATALAARQSESLARRDDPAQAGEALRQSEPGSVRSASDEGSNSSGDGHLGGGVEVRTAERSFAAGGDAAGAKSDPRQGDKSGAMAGALKDLSEGEKAQVQELKARDREVRTHEQAHIGASGGLSRGGASFEHERGPDGRMYAVAGEVQIDTSEGANADATIAKARRIRAAAMAPAEPSGQDRQVAAQAAQMEATARQEKASGEGENGQTGVDQTGASQTGVDQTGAPSRAPGASSSLETNDVREGDATSVRAGSNPNMLADMRAATRADTSANTLASSTAATPERSPASDSTATYGRRNPLLERASRAYAQAEGERGLALWGTGVSFAV